MVKRFSYTGVRHDGSKCKGVLLEADRSCALNMLRQQGITPISCHSSLLFFWRSLSLSQKADFFTHLHELLKTPLKIHQALSILQETQPAPLSHIASLLYGRVMAGDSFFTASQSCPELFCLFHGHLINIGEMTGQLTEIVGDIAAYCLTLKEQREALFKQLFSPLVALMLLGFLLIWLIGYGAPEFRGEQGSGFTAVSWGLWTAGGAVVLLGVRLVVKNPSYLYRFPIVGEWLCLRQVGSWAHGMALLLKRRLPLIQALDASVSLVACSFLQRAMAQVKLSVQNGCSLFNALETHLPTFSKQLVSIIAVGEKAGDFLPSFLYLDRWIARRQKLISEACIRFIPMGVMMGVGVLMVYLGHMFLMPIFSLDVSLDVAMGGR